MTKMTKAVLWITTPFALMVSSFATMIVTRILMNPGVIARSAAPISRILPRINAVMFPLGVAAVLFIPVGLLVGLLMLAKID